MLDELPSLELAATAVALVLALRVVVLLGREAGLVRGRARVESARARDLIGLVILAGALLYAWRAERTTTWFLGAIGVAIVAQLLGFYLRAAASKRPAPAGIAGAPAAAGSENDDEPEGDDERCPSCGNASLVELVDTERWLTGLQQATPVSAAVCPACGTLTGQVEDAKRIPVGPEHGTALRQSASTDPEPLEEPAEHDG
jgi:hypothetical protein